MRTGRRRAREEYDATRAPSARGWVAAPGLPTLSHTFERDPEPRAYRVAVFLSVRVRANHSDDIAVELFPLLLRARRVLYEKRRVRIVVRRRRNRRKSRRIRTTFVAYK